MSLFSLMWGSRLVHLRSRRDVVIDHQEVEHLLAVVLVQRGDQHAAGRDAHHLAWRQVGDRHQRLADEVLRVVVFFDAGEDHAVFAGAVVQDELQELVALRNGFAGLDLDRAEVGLAEGLEVDELLEERLHFDLLEVDRFRGLLRAALALRFHDRE